MRLNPTLNPNLLKYPHNQHAGPARTHGQPMKALQDDDRGLITTKAAAVKLLTSRM